MSLDFELIKNKSKEILASLPLSHYLKDKTIEVEFDENAETSYFNPSKFNIHIALKNIVEAIKGSKEPLTDLQLEKFVRSFLYHEISHALLTPNGAKNYASSYENLTPNLINILEDERIETILKDYYLLVDFRETLKSICKAEEPTCFEHFVFNAVRLKSCKKYQDLINYKVLLFIKETKDINAYGNVDKLLKQMEKLVGFLLALWAKVEEEKKNEQQESNGSSKEENSNSNEENESNEKEQKQNESSSKEENAEQPEQVEKQEPSKEEVEKAIAEFEKEQSNKVAENKPEEMATSIFTKSEAEKIVENAMENLKRVARYEGGLTKKLSDFKSESTTKFELLKAIIRAKGVGVEEEPAQFGYSGRFNAKRFMKDYNESYKWFEKMSFEETEITGKRAGKKVLNIWLDQSGSFQHNDNEVNKILKALAEIEEKQPTFEFHLIKWNNYIKIVEDKELRFSESQGGNALPIKATKAAYEKMNPNKDEFNIVLFDGNANFNKRHYEACVDTTDICDFKALKVFDNKRTLFISEPENATYIENVCKNTKGIISTLNYTGELARNVVKALELLF